MVSPNRSKPRNPATFSTKPEHNITRRNVCGLGVSRLKEWNGGCLFYSRDWFWNVANFHEKSTSNQT